MKFKKILAVALAAAMTLSLAACGGGGETPSGDPTPGGQQGNTPATGKNDEIIIGTWWTQPYDSNSESLEDAVDWVNAQDQPGDTEADLKTNAHTRKIYQKKWDNVAVIEQKYGVTFWWENLTYEGVKDSINTSVLAGAPDCDIYLVDSGMAMPAAANGLAMDLKTFLPADHDIFTTQKFAAYLDLGDGKAQIFYKVTAENKVGSTMPLAFNIQMLEDNNLEDPRILWEKGEWTWDKFLEYCEVLTQDTDGDGQDDQYGFCGYAPDTFEQLMMSNGAGIANTTTETLTSPAVAEALQFHQDLYNTYNVCYPYDFTSGAAHDTMRFQYREGNIGFFPTAAWIMAQNGDYDYDGSVGTTLPFDVAFVYWPVGPSGNKDTNAMKNDIGGELYIIPAGVAEPEKVFNVMYSFWDWDNGSTELRDDKEALNWWYKVTAKTEDLQNANFEVMQTCGENTTFDLWQSMGFYYDFDNLLNGTMTPAQFQETHKQQVQDGLDTFYGNN